MSDDFDLVDLVESIIEDAQTELHFDTREHALMGAGQIRRSDWLTAHDAEVARKAKVEGYAEGSAARWRCAEEYFNDSGECGPDSWDCRCPNPHREEPTQ